MSFIVLSVLCRLLDRNVKMVFYYRLAIHGTGGTQGLNTLP